MTPTLGKPVDVPINYAGVRLQPIRILSVLQIADMRHLSCGFPPVKRAEFQKSLLEGSLGMMINDEVMWNFSTDENYYEIFPLASIFDPPHIELRGT